MKFFNKWLSQGQTELAGLDIGTSSVKLVALRKDGQRWVVLSAVHVGIDPAEDPVLCEENTLKAIQECYKLAGPGAPRNVVCGISGQSVSVRGFNFPPLPDEAIEQAVKLEAQQTCALDIANSVIDYQMLAEPAQANAQGPKAGRKGYFVVGLQDAINRKLRLSQKAQVKTVLMDMDNLAILNCISLLPENQTNESIAVMDIGQSSANMTILGSDGAPFVRNLAGSGHQLLTAIGLKTKLPTAEIKKQLLDDQLPENSSLEIELKTAALKLISDAQETLRFYSLQQNVSKVSRLYLCGGFSVYKPFVRLIQQQLAIPCAAFDPLAVLHCPEHAEIRNVFDRFGPGMTVAAGLAMRSLNHVHN